MAKEEPEGGLYQVETTTSEMKKSGASSAADDTKIKTQLVLYSRHGVNPWSHGIAEINDVKKHADKNGVIDLTGYIGKKIKICLQNGRPFSVEVTRYFQLSTRNSPRGISKKWDSL